MRKVMAWPVTWLLFWVGHATSVIFLGRDWTFLYPAFRLYQWSMIRSSEIQDWAGLDSPWSAPNA